MPALKQPRRKPKPDTTRQKAARASANHLKDLKRAHGGPPSDVEVRERSAVRFVVPVPERSWCTSPAELCAELGEGSEPQPGSMELSE